MAFYDYKLKKRRDGELDLADWRGRVVLIVNTATGCGFTPQYEGLEILYEKYHEQGFEILDIPCNQFANQAKESDDEIRQFCTARYKTQFDQMAKAEVNGENELPLYTFLKAQAPSEEVRGVKNKLAMKAIAKMSKTAVTAAGIQWNFTKFLVDRQGTVVKRYSPTCPPADIDADIAQLI